MFCIFSISRSARLRRALLSKYELATSIAIAGCKPYLFFPSRPFYHPRSEAEWKQRTPEHTLLRPFSFFSTRALFHLSPVSRTPPPASSIQANSPFLQGLRQLGAVEFAFIFRHQDAHHLVQSGIRQAARFGLGLRAQAFEEQDAGCCEYPDAISVSGSPFTIVNCRRAPA
jgi:hypothetical protein